MLAVIGKSKRIKRRYLGFSGISLNQKGPQVWEDFVYKTDKLVVLAEGEQELLKQIHELKIRLGTEGWTEKESPKVTQPSILRADLGEDVVSFKFE